jgi:hypothetical protein
VQSKDVKEITEIVMHHAKKSHDMRVTEKEVMEKMKDAA